MTRSVPTTAESRPSGGGRLIVRSEMRDGFEGKGPAPVPDVVEDSPTGHDASTRTDIPAGIDAAGVGTLVLRTRSRGNSSRCRTN